MSCTAEHEILVTQAMTSDITSCKPSSQTQQERVRNASSVLNKSQNAQKLIISSLNAQ